MNFFNIISNAISGVGNAISNIVNSFNAPDEQKNKLKNVIDSQLNDLKSQIIDSQNNLEKEITERLKIDMQSDSWLSKNIRPLTLIFILIMFTISAIPSAFNINIGSSYVEILKGWGELAFAFYFGGRSFEKIIKVTKGNFGRSINRNTKNNIDK